MNVSRTQFCRSMNIRTTYKNTNTTKGKKNKQTHSFKVFETLSGKIRLLLLLLLLLLLFLFLLF